MAKYKHYDYNQGKMIPVYFKEQALPGTFEYALNYIVDNKLDLKVFAPRFKNDETGAPAFDPSILLKIVLYAYSLGIIHSRKIGYCCETNIIFKALSCDTVPHYTTIANFISTMDKEIAPLFRDVLLICDEMNLIGKTMFAIDGCKLPSNASKEWSGTKADFIKKKDKIEKSIKYILKKHKSSDEQESSPLSMKQEEEKHINNLRKKAEKVQSWLDSNEDKVGKNKTPIKSNITDNESAKMATSHGVIQGYNGVAAVDSKHQIIVNAEAFGQSNEHDLLKPMVKGTQNNFQKTVNKKEILKETVLTADSGFHSENNLKMLSEEEIEAYIPDTMFRKRDPRFSSSDRHKNPIKKTKKKNITKYFSPKEFKHDETKGTCICPAGKELWLKCKNFVSSNGFTGVVYMGRLADCRTCNLRSKCLRNPKTEARQVAFLNGKTKEKENSYTVKMIKKIETVKGRFIYSKRMGTVEPVFGNIRNNFGLDRFTLRSKVKVTTQWLLYCMVHNLGKIQKLSPQLA